MALVFSLPNPSGSGPAFNITATNFGNGPNGGNNFVVQHGLNVGYNTSEFSAAGHQYEASYSPSGT